MVLGRAGLSTFPSGVVLRLSIDLNRRDDMRNLFFGETKGLQLIKKIFKNCEKKVKNYR